MKHGRPPYYYKLISRARCELALREMYWPSNKPKGVMLIAIEVFSESGEREGAMSNILPSGFARQQWFREDAGREMFTKFLADRQKGLV